MTRRVRRFRLHSIAAALAAALATPLTYGQTSYDDTGPIIVGQRRQYDQFHINRPSVALELSGAYQRNEIANNAGRVRADQTLFQEELSLSTNGYVVHPNFIKWDFDGAFGLSQNFSSVNDVSAESYGTIYTWDASATLLQASNYPLTVHTSREQDWIFPEFGPAIETVTTEYGADLEIRSPTLPTRLSISHLESTQSGIQDFESFSYTRDAFNWHTDWRPTINQVFTWDYSYEKVDQSGGLSQNYETHDASLAHNLTFGKDAENRLTSIAHYTQQTGSVNLQHFRWDERLRLRHSDHFRTRYDFTYDHYDFASRGVGNDGGNTTDRFRGAAGFTHQLFESLTTNFDAAYQRTQDNGGGATDEVFANLNFDYRKNVPLGVLTANLGLLWNYQKSEGSSVNTNVFNQSVTFVDPQPIVFTGTNLDPSSIVITDPSGLILYQPGVDYTITTFPDRVEVNRIVGGRIASGSPVLIDYTLAPLPGATTETRALFTGARYDITQGFLNGLGVYGRFAINNQNINSSQPEAFVPNNYTDIIYGADYSIWRLIFGAEHQTHDSDVNPFDADRFYVRYVHRIGPETALNLNTAYTLVDYSNPLNHVNLFTVSGQIQHNFDRDLYAILTVLYRNERDDLLGDTEGFEEQFELRWRHRQLELYMMIRDSHLNTINQNESFQFFQIGLRREF